MDSSNSGSFQSSTGAPGDTDEFDSTTHSISSFLNPSNHFNHLLHPPPPPPFQDPGSPWTGPLPPVRPDPTLSNFNTYPINPNSSTMNTNTNTNTKTNHDSGHALDHHNPIGVSIKNPKKRTRASRRAPTTVLTTDTTNFRQMVQEFTGIPTSPFSRRLDLFRPTVQKIQQQPPPFLNNSNMNNMTAATSSSSYKLHPSSIHEFQKQPSTLLDLQNSMLSFQSLLQTSLPQQSNELNGLQKRWRGENDKLESFEGAKLDSGLENVVVASRSGGDDQVQGQESGTTPWWGPRGGDALGGD